MYGVPVGKASRVNVDVHSGNISTAGDGDILWAQLVRIWSLTYITNNECLFRCLMYNTYSKKVR